MGIIKSTWLSDHLKTLSLSDEHKQYLKKRGVDQNSSISFYTWNRIKHNSPCDKFNSSFGNNGFKLQDLLVFPIYSPRNHLVGIEAQKRLEDGSKRVFQYRTDLSKWNPFILNSNRAFNSLWEGNDIWLVEGVYDLIALEKVIPSCDTVISTMRAGMDQITVDMLTRYKNKTSTIYIAYDNDETGSKKASWLKSNFIKNGMNCEIWKYRGNDPNDVWVQGGEKLLRKYF